MATLTVSNVIALAGIILTLLAMLIGVIWAMLNNKLKLIVEKTKKNGEQIDKVKQEIHDIELGEQKILRELDRHFMRKDECEREHKILLSQLKDTNG